MAYHEALEGLMRQRMKRNAGLVACMSFIAAKGVPTSLFAWDTYSSSWVLFLVWVSFWISGQLQVYAYRRSRNYGYKVYEAAAHVYACVFYASVAVFFSGLMIKWREAGLGYEFLQIHDPSRPPQVNERFVYMALFYSVLTTFLVGRGLVFNKSRVNFGSKDFSQEILVRVAQQVAFVRVYVASSAVILPTAFYISYTLLRMVVVDVLLYRGCPLWLRPYVINIVRHNTSCDVRTFWLTVASAFYLVAFAEAVYILFHTYATQVYRLSLESSDPIPFLLEGLSHRDEYTRHYAYAELRSLASDQGTRALIYSAHWRNVVAVCLDALASHKARFDAARPGSGRRPETESAWSSGVASTDAQAGQRVRIAKAGTLAQGTSAVQEAKPKKNVLGIYVGRLLGLWPDALGGAQVAARNPFQEEYALLDAIFYGDNSRPALTSLASLMAHSLTEDVQGVAQWDFVPVVEALAQLLLALVQWKGAYDLPSRPAWFQGLIGAFEADVRSALQSLLKTFDPYIGNQIKLPLATADLLRRV